MTPAHDNGPRPSCLVRGRNSLRWVWDLNPAYGTKITRPNAAPAQSRSTDLVGAFRPVPPRLRARESPEVRAFTTGLNFESLIYSYRLLFLIM